VAHRVYLPTHRRLIGLFFMLFGLFVLGMILTGALSSPR
jgi:hypothetical protein